MCFPCVISNKEKSYVADSGRNLCGRSTAMAAMKFIASFRRSLNKDFRAELSHNEQ